MIEKWAKGKWWPLYAGLTILFAYWAIRLRSFPDWSIFFTDTANLGIHEIGHEAFRFFGEFMTVAGGTITEIGVPLGFAIFLYIKRWFFLSLFCLLWTSTALYSASIYAGDAVKQNLILINIRGELSSGGEGGHDWTYLLDALGILKHDQVVAGVFEVLAVVISFGVVFVSIYLTYRALVHGKIKQAVEEEKLQETASKSLYPNVTRSVYGTDPVHTDQK